MATATGTNVKFVKVQTKQQYTDYDDKDGALIFVENERKIYVDGIAYGFSDSDVANKFVKLTGDTMTGSLKIGNTANNITHSNNIIKFNHTDEVAREIKPFSYSTSGGLTIVIGDTDYEFAENFLRISKGQDNSVTISGVADPENHNEAVNKGYLDTNVINKIGANGGIATLDNTGKVPSGQLPSYVDDVVEYAKYADFPAPADAEKGKLYIDLSNNKVYRWSGSAYVNVSDGNAHLTLGETASTAYRGDHGLAAYTHINLTGIDDNPHNITKKNVGLANVANYGVALQTQAEAGELDNVYMTPLKTKNAIEKLAPKLAWEVVE